MSNADKLKRKAAEFEQKKQYDRALELYVQVLDKDDGSAEERDVPLYNRVGDLHLRLGNTEKAVSYYEKAVDFYADGGYLNNAIALCNKILRHTPGRSSIYYKLGKISAKKGFNSDAKQNFLEYADRMQKQGKMDEAFRALEEFADLCPGQDDIRLLLAEQLSRAGRKDDAVEQLQILYEALDAEGRTNEAAATLERMKAIDPSITPRRALTPRASATSGLVFLDLDDAPRPATKPVEGLEPTVIEEPESVPPSPLAPEVAGLEATAIEEPESVPPSPLAPEVAGLEATAIEVPESVPPSPLAPEVAGLEPTVVEESELPPSSPASEIAQLKPTEIEEPELAPPIAPDFKVAQLEPTAIEEPEPAPPIAPDHKVAEPELMAIEEPESAPPWSLAAEVIGLEPTAVDNSVTMPPVDSAVAGPVSNIADPEIVNLDPPATEKEADPLSGLPFLSDEPKPKKGKKKTPVKQTPAPQPARAAPTAATPRTDDDFIDLADWLAEDDNRSTRMVASDERRAVEGQADFEQMLAKFKQGIAANVDDEDAESHYDLGVAYREMGLIDEAISEFQTALRGTPHRIRTYEALGQCFIDKSDYDVAQNVLTRAVNEPDAEDDQLVGVLYLLGVTSENLERWAEASAYYQRVVAVNIDFRDVEQRIVAVGRSRKR